MFMFFFFKFYANKFNCIKYVFNLFLRNNKKEKRQSNNSILRYVNRVVFYYRGIYRIFEFKFSSNFRLKILTYVLRKKKNLIRLD